MGRNYQNSTNDADRDRDEGIHMQVLTPAERAEREAYAERMLAEYEARPVDEDGNFTDTDDDDPDTLLGVAYPEEQP